MIYIADAGIFNVGHIISLYLVLYPGPEGFVVE